MVGAVLTSIVIGISLWQAYDAKKTAIEAVNTARRTVEGYERSERGRLVPGSMQRSPDGLRLDYGYTNIGRSAVTIIQHRIAWRWTRVVPPPIPPPFPPEEPFRPMAMPILANSTETSHGRFAPLRSQPTPAEWMAIDAGAIFLFIRGTIRYMDVFDRVHFREYGMMYFPQSAEVPNGPVFSMDRHLAYNFETTEEA